MQILSSGPAGVAMVKDRIPRITGEDDSIGFALSAVQKDAGIFSRMLASYDLPRPLMDIVEGQLAELVQAGLAEDDVAAYVSHAYHERAKG